MDLWNQYQAAVEEHRTARQHADRVDRSVFSTTEERHRAACASARAAQRCVVALQAYRDDLLSGIELVSDDEDDFVTTTPASKPVKNPSHLIDGTRRPITDLDDNQLDHLEHEFAKGRISIPDLADRWNVSVFSLVALLQGRGVIEFESEFGRRLGHIDYTVRIRQTRPQPCRVAIDYEAVARDRLAGLGYRELGEKHQLSVDRTRNALRQCRRLGLLPARKESTPRYERVAQYIQDNPLKSHAEIARHFKITTRQLTADLYAAKKAVVINNRKRRDDGQVDPA
jgi:hypothetical protein